MGNYLQGKYKIKNPQKYFGDPNNVQFRSSWELKLFTFLDNTPTILKWGSEEVIIPYISPLDNRPHRYFVDVVVLFKTRDGKIKRALVEVKPKEQTVPPKPPKRQTAKSSQRYLEEVQTYVVNDAKWKAAKEWCGKKNYDFMILTEDHLYGKPK